MSTNKNPLANALEVEILGGDIQTPGTANVPVAGIDTKGWGYLVLIVDNTQGVLAGGTVDFKLQQTVSGSFVDVAGTNWQIDENTPNTTLVAEYPVLQFNAPIRVEVIVATANWVGSVAGVLFGSEHTGEHTLATNAAKVYAT